MVGVSIANEVPVRLASGPQLDSFGSLRVSNKYTLLDSKLLFDKNPIVWGEAVNGASSAISYSSPVVDLTCAGTDGDYAIRMTKMRVPYQAGKSLAHTMTGVLFPEVGYTKRFGYFNTAYTAPYTANIDGIYLESDGTDVYICLATDGVVQRVPQSQWNEDTFDGRGVSRKTIDWDNLVILNIDMEWLSAGDVRVGFQFDSVPMTAHTFRNTNNTSLPYMKSPNHSLRYEVRGDGGPGTSSVRQVCGASSSEGGYELTGALYSINRGITPFTTGNNTLEYPLLSIRLRSGREEGIISLEGASLICTTTADFLWKLTVNPTIAGTDQASWQDVYTSSAVEYDISRDATNTISGGTVISSGYVRGTNQSGGDLAAPLKSLMKPGVDVDGTADELVLSVQNLSSGIEDYYASLTWAEPV